MTDLMELYRLADDEGITIDCFELEKRDAISVMDFDKECFIAINPIRLTSSRDEIVKLAHEIGHCCTGSFYNQWSTCDVRQKHENRADKWAIGQLVPESELGEAIAAGIDDIFSLAEYFNVTEDLIKKAFCWYKYGSLDTKFYLG